METVFPIAFLPREHGLAIAIISYNGWLNFGLLGDYDAVPDLEAIGEAVEEAIDEYVVARAKAAREPRPRPSRLARARATVASGAARRVLAVARAVDRDGEERVARARPAPRTR